MTSLSSRSASAYFLAVSFRGAKGVLRVIDDPGDHQIGPRLALGHRRGLDDRRHQGAILVGLDLEGDGLGEHQVVVRLPPLLGLALANLGETFQPLLDLQERR